jgi:hypothetical protein
MIPPTVTSQICPDNKYIVTSTSSTDVPGPAIDLWEDPDVPLYMYGNNSRSVGNQIYVNSMEWQFIPQPNIVYVPNTLPTTLSTIIIRDKIQNYITNFSYDIPIAIDISGTLLPSDDTSGNIITISLPISTDVSVYYNGTTLSNQSTTTEIIYNTNVENGGSNIELKLTPPDANPYNFRAKLYLGTLRIRNITLRTPIGISYTFKLFIPSIIISNSIMHNIYNSNIICNIVDFEEYYSNCVNNAPIYQPIYPTSLFTA